MWEGIVGVDGANDRSSRIVKMGIKMKPDLGSFVDDSYAVYWISTLKVKAAGVSCMSASRDLSCGSRRESDPSIYALQVATICLF
jgi:hypothetical protein